MSAHPTEPTGAAERRVATAEFAGRTCPYCRFPLKEGAEVIVCGSCRAAHHVDCWTDNAGCAVLGCAAAPTASDATQAMPVVPQPRPPIKPFEASGALPTSQPAQSSPPPPTRGGRSWPAGLSAAVLVLALAIGGVAAAIVISKSNNKSTLRQAAVSTTTSGPTTTVTTTPPVTTTGTQTSSSTVSTNDSSSSGGGGAAAAAFRQYWGLLNSGSYSQAYAMETPDEQGTETTFVSDKHATQPAINIVSVGPSSYAGSGEEDVTVDFYAQNQQGSDTMCREFSGTAVLVKSGGQWLYGHPDYQETDHPNLSGSSCQ